ncbi:nitroreductase family protein [Mechercharimyces sp. CAU 1602]|uniref:nitroreductase family protein n=1 Tax=Mechercharimyces sp. CAU 1602 TaxID=2973933 RepID=UPI002162731C|nr:nitroreductase family protein [Mechercharimyces sp. CAU 1602]MCS1352059.1 nitroreductase family protein [Mechercharimyces sp. CAU 1602]
MDTYNELLKVMHDRKSVKLYQKDADISKEELSEMLKEATTAPSSWNLQHWHFMVFKGEEVKQKLLPIAFNQPQVKDASAVIAILGDLEANKNAEAIFRPILEGGFMTEEAYNALLGNINGAYQMEGTARNSAILNASLAAMQFMLIAKAKGWDTCPMGGFNPVQLVEEFNIDKRYTPVMLIALGKAAKEAHPTSRFDIEKMTTWIEG